MSGIIGTSHSKSKVIGRSIDTAKAWVSYTSGEAIRDDYNISSIGHRGTGSQTINFAITMPNINYCAVGSVARTIATTNNNAVMSFGTVTTTSIHTETYHANETNADFECMNVLIFGD